MRLFSVQFRICAALAATVLPGVATSQAAPTIDAITFTVEPGQVYVPLDEAGLALRWPIVHDSEAKVVRLPDASVPYRALRTLVDGGQLIRIADLQQAGAPVRQNEEGSLFKVGTTWRHFTAVVGPKRAEVNLAEQRLRGWQGERLVLESRVSSGKGGRTPSGNFTAGPYKARKHYSSRYNNAAMPWSVQVTGHVFIHGFTSVPKYPASHGCIRVPLNEGNPARFFYEWIDKGTPIKVVRK